MTLPLMLSLFWGNVLLVFLAAPPAMRVAMRWGVVDRPGSAPHKRHAQATPLVGGWLLMAAVLLSGLMTGYATRPSWWVLVAGGSVVFVIGLVDDKRPLPPHWKFGAQLLATFWLLASGWQVHFADFLLGGLWALLANLAVTTLWMVGETNAFNLIDSADGLAMGVGLVAAAFFAWGTYEAGQWALTALAVTLVGAGVGVLFFNLMPSRLFLGDAGSQLLGFLLAGLGLAYNPAHFPQASSWFVPILVLGLPIFDTTLVTISRWRRRRPWFQANLDHTYHRLVQAGFAPTRVVFALHLVTLALASLAWLALRLPPLWANLLFGGVLVVGSAALVALESLPPFRDYLRRLDA